MSNPVLHAEHLQKTYHDGHRTLDVLTDINLSVTAGESVAIIGKSGTGKSTLLNLLGLLDAPTNGLLRFAGMDSHDLSDRQRTALRRKEVGFVFQSHHLLSHFSALDNVIVGANISGKRLRSPAKKRAVDLLTALGLDDRLSHKPTALSGGEQQRVGIARALIHEPSVLLCDEPTGNLDPDTADKVIQDFRQVVRQENIAMVMVTHDHELAAKMDRQFILRNGELSSADEKPTKTE